LHAWPTLLKDEESARDNYVLVCNFGDLLLRREKTGGREGRRDVTEREGKRIPLKSHARCSVFVSIASFTTFK